MVTRILFNYNIVSVIFTGVASLALRVTLSLLPLPWMQPALQWSVTGMRWRSGYTLYAEVYTTLDPLAAIFYGIFGSLIQYTLFHIIASGIIITILAFYYNNILIKHRIFQKHTLLPAFLIIVLTAVYPDQLLLSPALLGMLFVLPALDMIIAHLRQEQKEEYFFRIGLLMGFACLFYQGYLLFVLMIMLITVLFTVSTPRKIVLMALGTVFPYLFFIIYYFWINNLDNWYYCNISWWLHWPDQWYFENITLLKISIIPGILLLLSIFATFTARFIHFQYRVLQLHITWILFAFAAFFIGVDFGLFKSIIFIIPLTYFITHLFIAIKNLFIRELLWLSSISGMLIIFFFVLKKGDDSSKNFFIRQSAPAQSSKVLLLSDSVQYSIGNIICGPYAEWNRFHQDFDDLEGYASLSHIYGTIHNEKPDYIVDGKNFIPHLMVRIPELERDYVSVRKGFYKRKEIAVK